MTANGLDPTTLAGLLLVVTLVASIARTIRLPYEVAPELASLGLAFVPGVPGVTHTYQAILTVFLPVLLFHSAYSFTAVPAHRSRRGRGSGRAGHRRRQQTDRTAARHAGGGGSQPRTGSLGNRARLGRPLPLGWTSVIAWAGLRGAVSLAAALSLPANVADRDLMLTVTSALVLFTLLVQGLTMAPLLRRLGLAGSE